MTYIFIVNPIAGTVQKQQIIKEMKNSLHEQNIAFEILYTEYSGHAKELASQYKHASNTIVVCVGGDGSINEVGSGLLGGNTPMGIIPFGSGNGLARHLKIPLQPVQALQHILKGTTIKMDVGLLNDLPFFVTCGFGFEAEVAHNFSLRKSRGLLGYVKEIIKLYPTYSAESYKVTADDEVKVRKAFSVSIANSSQYGNNAVIAREASVTDGKLDLCIIKSYPKVFGPHMGISLFMNNLHNSSFYRGKKIEEVVIEKLDQASTVHGHLDGEAIKIKLPIKVKCIPNAVQVIVPKNLV